MKYDAATVCCICKNKKRSFDPEQDDWRKVHDHDHVTGYFFGAAHNLCNKRRRVVFQIPCFIHNLRGYDSHLIVHAFNKFPDREIRVIGESIEKYKQIEWGKNLVFREFSTLKLFARKTRGISLESGSAQIQAFSPHDRAIVRSK